MAKREPTRMYVVTEAIRRNQTETDADYPPICVRHSNGQTSYARTVEINGPSRLVYDPAGLPDGARVWVETDGPFTLS